MTKFHLGGIIYFAWSHNTRQPAPDRRPRPTASSGPTLAAGHPVPLLISTDQEHGLVARVGPPATLFPGAMALGAAPRPRTPVRRGRITGRELRAIGINQNYAPVADVNVNPANPVIGVRSFGADPEAGGRTWSPPQVSGLPGRRQVTATAKHFPGHGDTGDDSHYGLPDDHPHPRAVGASSTRRRSGPRSRPASTRS